MVRIRLRFVNSFISKSRKSQRTRYYFRRPGMKAVPLLGIPGGVEFMAAYHAALAQAKDNATANAPTEIGASRTVPGTVDALVAAYYRSVAWRNDLSEDSRKNRKYIIERFREQHGSKRVTLLRRDHFDKMLAEMPVRLGTKWQWLKVIRALMRSGIPAMIKDDPTAGITVKGARKTEGHHTWEPQEIERYRAHWPLGTMQRLVLEFALETFSRRGEIARLGPQHIHRKDGDWWIKIERTHGSRDVDIPMTDELLAAVRAMKVGHLTYVHGQNGKPLSKGALGTYFRRWVAAAGLPRRCTLHGLKKSGMVALAMAGATAPEFMAGSGHRDIRVAQHYIEKAFAQPELAGAAIGKLRTKRGRASTNIAIPAYKQGRKTR
jgi:integrase